MEQKKKNNKSTLIAIIVVIVLIVIINAGVQIANKNSAQHGKYVTDHSTKGSKYDENNTARSKMP